MRINIAKRAGDEQRPKRNQLLYTDSAELTKAEHMSKMNKVVITKFGDESKLVVIEDDLSDPAAGEVQLSVEYPVVSGPGVNMRRGAYPYSERGPLTSGYNVLGKERVKDNGCGGFKVGDRVAVSFFGLRRSSKNFMPDLSCSLSGLGPERSPSRSRLPSGLREFRRHIGNMQQFAHGLHCDRD